jgi:hydrogenase nickel incorporation protein HypA/HybF
MGHLALFVIIEKWNMRELQVIRLIFDQVLRTVKKEEENRITDFHIALGELSELDPASIQTQWRKLRKGTLAEQAQLHFRLIPAEAQCMACFSKYRPVDKKILCPSCGSFGAKILTGEECYLESIEMENE